MSRGVAIRLTALGGIWGASFLFIKVALEGLTPLQIASGRLLFGALLLAAAVAAGAGRYPETLRAWGQLSVLAVLANVVPFVLFAWGEQRISSSLAGVLNATTPLCTAAIALFALRTERLTRAKAVGLVLGFSGAALIVRPWDDAAGSLPGQLACIGAALCYGVAFVYTRRVISGRIAPVTAAAGQVTVGAALALLIAAGGVVAGDPMPRLDLRVLGSIAALGILGTGVAYLLSFRLIELAGATTASMVTYVIPVVAVALGVLVLDEPVTWQLFVGAGIVITGIAIAEAPRPAPRVHSAV
jgi:drug/metabolite transporter (DMT)-like permease